MDQAALHQQRRHLRDGLDLDVQLLDGIRLVRGRFLALSRGRLHSGKRRRLLVTRIHVSRVALKILYLLADLIFQFVNGAQLILYVAQLFLLVILELVEFLGELQAVLIRMLDFL